MSGGGGGGGAFDYGQSQANSKSFPASLSFAPFLLGQAFGLNPIVQKKGGFAYSSTPNGSQGINLANPSFDPSQFNALGSLANTYDTNIISNTPYIKAFGNQALSNAGDALSLFSNTLLPSAGDLAATGFKTSIDPYIAQAKQQFTQDFLPAAAAQYGSLGLDPGDSDFGAAVAREAARISTNLGTQDVALQEAANQRRMQGIPLAAELSQGSALLPLNMGQDILNYQQAAAQGQRASSPGGQLLDLLAQLSGINTQGQNSSASSSRAFNFGLQGQGQGGGGVGYKGGGSQG